MKKDFGSKGYWFGWRIFCYWFGVAKKPRVFDRAECKNCVFKGGSYCWNQCPYNIWRKF